MPEHHAHSCHNQTRLRGSGVLQALRRSETGAVALYAGLSMSVLVGAAGLGVDVASWYRAKRVAQNAADAAAYAGALDLAKQGLGGSIDLSSIQASAADAAARNGITSALTVRRSPTSGLAAGDGQAVEVIVSEPAPLYFARLFLDEAPQVRARAVAKAVVSDACVWSLHPTARGAVTVSGGAQLNLGCGVVVNSTHEEAAIEQNGASCLAATSVTVRGGYSGTCVTPEPETLAPDYGNPLSTLSPPSYGGCNYNSTHVNNGTVNLSPGVYCNGLQISGGTVVFQPGLYVINRGTFKVTGSATVRNTENASGGVTFFLTGSGNNYAEVDIASGANVTLTPITTGPLANVLFYQDPAAPADRNNKFSGGSSMQLTGIIYFPVQSVEFSGGSSANEAQILLVASTLTFTGTSYIDADYAQSLLPEQFFARMME